MRFTSFHLLATCIRALGIASDSGQIPLLRYGDSRNVSSALFAELEELARIVDISYCVGLGGSGIIRPFRCLSRCTDFPRFELITTWNTGPLLSDSCGYLALDHGKERIIVAFRGTYSIANTVVDLSTIPQEYIPYPDSDRGEGAGSGAALHNASSSPGLGVEYASDCNNCTAHSGFYASWLNTRTRILPDLQQQLAFFPHYTMHLVGHSLGGAVAALAGLDLQARGWDPTVTTFGEPRAGNLGLMRYIDERFDLVREHQWSETNCSMVKYRRVTHVDDPVPLLPLSEWGYAMHAGEIFISKAPLSPDVQDLEHCQGDNDDRCIAGQDSGLTVEGRRGSEKRNKWDLLGSVEDEIEDVKQEPWGVPSRYKLWELFFAHRDYFWRLGLCVPGGDPLGGGKKYELPEVHGQ